MDYFPLAELDLYLWYKLYFTRVFSIYLFCLLIFWLGSLHLFTLVSWIPHLILRVVLAAESKFGCIPSVSVCWDAVYRPRWPQTYRDVPTFAFRVVGLKKSVIMPEMKWNWDFFDCGFFFSNVCIQCHSVPCKACCYCTYIFFKLYFPMIENAFLTSSAWHSELELWNVLCFVSHPSFPLDWFLVQVCCDHWICNLWSFTLAQTQACPIGWSKSYLVSVAYVLQRNG